MYDGSTSPSSGYLDNTLITGSEDSLVMLFRQGTWDDWKIVDSFTLNTGPSVLDKRGTVVVDTLMKGEYALGILDHSVGFDELDITEKKVMNLFPNPADDILTIEILRKYDEGTSRYRVIDTGGRVFIEGSLADKGSQFQINTSGLSKGLYLLIMDQKGKHFAAEKFVIR